IAGAGQHEAAVFAETTCRHQKHPQPGRGNIADLAEVEDDPPAAVLGMAGKLRFQLPAGCSVEVAYRAHHQYLAFERAAQFHHRLLLLHYLWHRAMPHPSAARRARPAASSGKAAATSSRTC